MTLSCETKVIEIWIEFRDRVIITYELYVEIFFNKF